MKLTDPPLQLVGPAVLLKRSRHRYQPLVIDLLHYVDDKRFEDAPDGVFVVIDYSRTKGSATRHASYSAALIEFIMRRKSIGHMSSPWSPA